MCRVSVRINRFKSAVQQVIGRTSANRRFCFDIVLNLVLRLIFSGSGSEYLCFCGVRCIYADGASVFVKCISGDQIVCGILDVVRPAVSDLGISSVIA